MENLIPLKELIDILELEPLPWEGGYFKQHYASADKIDSAALSSRYENEGVRAVSGAIYYLITPDNFSTMHKLRTDELWHFYYGDSAEQLCLYPDGRADLVKIGVNFAAGERPVHNTPAGVWQGTRLAAGGRYALFGTTMAPIYDDSDFIIGNVDEISNLYPEASELIKGFFNE
ncbi:MAG: cupin domain-containing protein [Bacteroidetes bacterium]|nr:cupin domain-containing protein [Bacteroidota bacterium]